MPDTHTPSHTTCPSFLVAAVIFSVFTLTGIVSAAWVDAPNTPPGYGISGSGCTFPCLEEDFRPMNLGATMQIKQGNIAAGGYYSANDLTVPKSYFITPYANGGNSGKLDGSMSIASAPGTSLSVGRVEPYLGASAKLIVNNPETAGKYGSIGDAIYAYADSVNAAISAEQANPAGYALYSSGGINYFEGNVKVGSAADQKSLCLNDDCKSAWPMGIGVVDFISCSVAEYIPSCMATCPGGKIISAFGVLSQGPDCTGSPSIAGGGSTLSVVRTNNCNNTSTTFGASCATGVASGYAPGTQTYSVPGTYTFAVPANIYSINVEAWGGGGGGGYGVLSFNYNGESWNRSVGGAGGSGGYVRKNAIAVNPGDVFTVNVGVGGLGAARPTTKNTPTTRGSTGGTSSFIGSGVALYANGGGGNVGFDYYCGGDWCNGIDFCVAGGYSFGYVSGVGLPVSGGTASGGAINTPGLSGAGCNNGAGMPPDIPGPSAPVTVDHNMNTLPFSFGKGATGHHYPVNPITSNSEVNANSGSDGGVIVWW